MLPDPAREILVRHLPRRHGEHGNDDLGIGRRKSAPIQNQERFKRDKRRPLIAVNKRMIPRNGNCVQCRQLHDIGLAIAGMVQPPSQSTFQQAFVPNSRSATVGRKLFLVNRKDKRTLQPDRHFASSRSALKRRFMISRATSICAGKSGSATVSFTPSACSIANRVSPLPTPSLASSSFGRISRPSCRSGSGSMRSYPALLGQDGL